MNDMLLEWLGTYLVHSTVLLLLAAISSRIPTLARPAMQVQIWKIALVAGFLTSAIQTWTPLGSPWGMASELRVATPTDADVAAVTPKTLEAPATYSAPRRVDPLSISALSPSPEPIAHGPVYMTTTGMVAWVMGVLLLGTRLLVSGWSLRRLMQHRRPVTRQSLLDEFYELAGRAQVPFARLSQSDTLDQPMATLRGEICVPSRALALSSRLRRAMLAHELAHVAHGDPVWRWLSRIIETLVFFQPLNFLATRELARHSELLADARAASLGASPRNLAECLHQFARWQLRPVPAVACAMAHRPSELVERIQRLTEDESMTDQRPRHFLALLAVTLLCGMLVLPGVSSGKGWFSSKHRGTSVEINDSGGNVRMDIHHRSDDLEIELDAHGRFEFAEDESDIGSIDGEFDLTVNRDGVEERFLFEGDGGAVERRYWQEGQESGFDGAARGRFAELMPLVFRISGIDAHNRVQRLLRRGGPEAVLDEVELIHSDLVARRYLSVLSETATLDMDHLERAVDLAATGISSDLEHRLALAALMEHQTLDATRWRLLIESTTRISSDLEQRLALSAAAGKMPDDEALVDAYVVAAAKIASDLEHRLALVALHESPIGPASLSRLIASTQDISSDLEQRLALKAFAGQAARSSAAAEYITAVDAISSDLEARLALSELIAGGLDAAYSVELVRAASEGIGSDLELRLLLDDVLSEHASDRAVREAVRQAAEQSLSGFEREMIYRQLAR